MTHTVLIFFIFIIVIVHVSRKLVPFELGSLGRTVQKKGTFENA